MIRWTESFLFRVPPRCPVCQDDLQQSCWLVRGGVAFCASCAATTYPGQPLSPPPPNYAPVVSFLAWFHSTRAVPHFTEILGIRFYTPHPRATRRAAAHLDPWHGDPPAHPYLADGFAAESPLAPST
jgi:hypothetical protein